MEDARRSREQAYAAGTYKNLKCHWVKYLNFCSYFDLVAFPVSAMALSWYAQHLTESLRAHASIVAYITSVKTLHKLLEYNTDGFTGFVFKLTLQGIRRMNEHVVKRAKPMTPALLRKIYDQLDHRDPHDAVFWAASLLAFFLLFRKSNLVPETQQGYDHKKQLSRGDVVLTDVNAVVGIRWAKNHQFLRELLTFPLPRLTGSKLCPVAALENMMRLVPGNREEHMFKLPKGGSLTYKVFQSRLRETLKQAGVQDFAAYSSHSYRRVDVHFVFCAVYRFR